MKTIVHIASHTTNIGDGALVKGMQSTLPADLETDIKFIDHCITDFLYNKISFDQRYVDWLNDNADLLLIGGGGFIMGKKRETSGIALPVEIETLKTIKIPIVVYAIGYNLFFGERLQNARALSALIAEIRDLGGLFSVRNDGSKERLQNEIGADAASSLWEVPDPGAFVPIEPMLHPQIDTSRRNIVLQLAGDRLANRIGPASAEPRKNSRRPFGLFKKRRKEEAPDVAPVWAAIANACNRIGANEDVNFVIAPHIYDDLSVADDFVSAARKVRPPIHFSALRVEVAGVLRGTRHASGYFDLYRQADLVVGMRGHSMIVAVGVGTPSVGIVSHPKVAGFLRECDLENWSADIAAANLEDALVEKIGSLLEDGSEWKSRRAAAMEKMVEKRKDFHREIKRLLT
jgi:polysaccharide pyruvyl transferase WcaK-like protein